MSNKRALKRRLYGQGIAAAKSVGIEPAVYICPLCLDGYEEDAIADGTLTLEHVPAEALGGNGIILTCKKCNNTAGHALESHAHRRERQNNFVAKLLGDAQGHGGRGVATFGNARVNIELTRDNGTINFKVSSHNDPAAIAASEEFFRQGSVGDDWKGLHFQVTSVDAYHPRRAKVADLKAAFLTVTAAFGYTFAMHDFLASVRDQISHPDSLILPNWWGTLDIPPRSIAIVPQEGLVAVSLPSGGVVLPWPSISGEQWSLAVAGGKRTMRAHGWHWPLSFEAYLDHH